MKLRWLFLLTGVAACATTGSSSRDDSPEASNIPNSADAGDADTDASDAEAAPCSDCEFFPETCTVDVLCPDGPFGANVTGGFDLRTQINVIRGRSSNDVWAAGAMGALAHFDGNAWTPSDPGDHETLRVLWLREQAEVSFGVFERLYARGSGIPEADAGPSAGGWTVQGPVTPPTYRATDLQPVSGWAAPGATWLWCTARAWRPGWTTGLWRMRISPTPNFELGYGATPTACTTLPCSQMTSVHGATANKIWAVGFGGAVFRITDADGDMPLIEAFNARTWNSLLGVWSPSDAEAWAVGAMGTIRHYTGQPLLWDVVSDVPTTEDLNAVWGSSPTDIWAVGNAGVVVHYDGNAWSRVKVAGLGKRRPDLTTVWVSSEGHVWIGGQGVVLSLGGKP